MMSTFFYCSKQTMLSHRSNRYLDDLGMKIENIYVAVMLYNLG